MNFIHEPQNILESWPESHIHGSW